MEIRTAKCVATFWTDGQFCFPGEFSTFNEWGVATTLFSTITIFFEGLRACIKEVLYGATIIIGPELLSNP